MRSLLGSLLVAAVLAAPLAASAGGVVTDGRGDVTGFHHPDLTYVNVKPFDPDLEPEKKAMVSTKGPGKCGLDPECGRLGPYELEQIAAGLITEEEASSGCGASAAGGGASVLSLLPVGLLVAGLRFRRRRK